MEVREGRDAADEASDQVMEFKIYYKISIYNYSGRGDEV